MTEKNFFHPVKTMMVGFSFPPRTSKRIIDKQAKDALGKMIEKMAESGRAYARGSARTVYFNGAMKILIDTVYLGRKAVLKTPTIDMEETK
jgi:hypothetical protein